MRDALAVGRLETERLTIRPAEILSLSPLIVAGVVALLLRVVEFGLFIDLPLVALVLIYVFWITANYFIEIVEHRALGHDDWPVFSQETLVAGRNQVGVVFFALVLATAGAYWALRYFGMDVGAQTLLGAGLACLPGSIALLAVTREYARALDPSRVLAAAAGMGYAYLYCLAGAAAIFVLLGLAQSRGGLLWYFVLVYGLLLQAWLIGSIVYARRTVLGVHAPRSPEARADKARAETVAIRNRILTHAYGFATRGNKAGALKYIDAYIAADDDTVEARLWMLNEIVRWDDSDLVLAYGKRVIEYCELHGFADEAARVRLICEHWTARQ